MFWVISVYFNIRNTLPKSGTFLLGHPVYTHTHTHTHRGLDDLRECHFTGQLKQEPCLHLRQTYGNNTARSLRKRIQRLLFMQERSCWLMSYCIYSVNIMWLRMMYLLEEFQLPHNLSFCLYHTLFAACICVVFSVDVGYYLLQVYVFAFFRSTLKMTHV